MTAIDSKTIIFRVDANRATGLGHLARCLALGEECRRRGWAAFCLGLLDEDATGRIAALGGQALRRPPGGELGQEIAALRAAQKVTGAQVLVTDSYTLPDGYHLHARQLFPVVVMIDDLNPSPPAAHVVINPNIYAPRLTYQPVFPDTKLLLGPAYALLSAAVCKVERKETRPNVKSVLISLGGSDPGGLTIKVVRALRRAGIGEVWHVVVGPGFLTGEELARLAQADRRVLLHFAPKMLVPLLAESDLVICAGGVTASEAAATGTPALILVQSENQRLAAEEFDARGAAVNLGWGHEAGEDDIANAVAALARDVERRRRMGDAGRAIFDANGPARCLDAIEEQIAS